MNVRGTFRWLPRPLPGPSSHCSKSDWPHHNADLRSATASRGCQPRDVVTWSLPIAHQRTIPSSARRGVLARRWPGKGFYHEILRLLPPPFLAANGDCPNVPGQDVTSKIVLVRRPLIALCPLKEGFPYQVAKSIRPILETVNQICRSLHHHLLSVNRVVRGLVVRGSPPGTAKAAIPSPSSLLSSTLPDHQNNSSQKKSELLLCGNDADMVRPDCRDGQWGVGASGRG
jgi:hypothetical protein